MVVRTEARDQSLKMAEKYLSLQDTGCVQRSFCEIAMADNDQQSEFLQAANAAEQSVK